MFCKYCGTKIDDDAIFCCSCGKKLVAQPAEPAPQPEPVVPKVEPVIPEFEPVAPKVEPVIPEFEPVAPKVEPVIPEFEPVAPKVEPVIPEFEPVAPKVESVIPEFQPVPQPKAAPQPKAPSNKLLPLIAAMVLGFFSFIEVIRGFAGAATGIGVLANLITCGAAVLIVLTLFRVLKQKDLFFAISMFALAFSELITLGGIFWYVSALTMPAFAIAGVHYLLKGKVFNNMIKMIMAFAVWGMGFILFIHFISLHMPFYLIFSSLITSAASGLLIFSYSPNK